MAISDIWKSERGFFAVLLIIAATVLTALSHMTIEQWREFSLWIFGIYATAKTATSVADSIMAPKTTIADVNARSFEASMAKPAAPATPAAMSASGEVQS